MIVGFGKNKLFKNVTELTRNPKNEQGKLGILLSLLFKKNNIQTMKWFNSHTVLAKQSQFKVLSTIKIYI